MANANYRQVLSLFSGCGGMDLGFEGGFYVLAPSVNKRIHPEWIEQDDGNWVKLRPTCFNTVFANDISAPAKVAWQLYFGKRGTPLNVFHQDSIVDLVKLAKSRIVNVFPSVVDVVTGGFPCQDFSVAGLRKGFNSHKSHRGALISEDDEPTAENRGRLYIWMRKVIEITKPKVFVAENVKGLVTLSDVKSMIQNDFRATGDGGYLVVEAKVLNAVNYGVPQNRERVFFIGLKKSALKKNVINIMKARNVPPEYDLYPVLTHSTNYKNLDFFEFYGQLEPAVTSGQAIRDLPEPRDAVDPAQQFYSKASWLGKYSQGQAEINLNSPSTTIRAEHHGNIEYRRLSESHGGRNIEELANGLPERRLTVRECARLQMFPDDYEFVVRDSKNNSRFILSPSNAYKLIGNAVPPLLAYNIAQRLIELWPIIFKE